MGEHLIFLHLLPFYKEWSNAQIDQSTSPLAPTQASALSRSLPHPLSPMTRHYKHLLHAASAAELSPLEIKHGAVLVFGGKIIGRGYNSDRSRLGASNMVALHSEVAALHDVQCVL